jgi:hypothetical protein
MKSPIFIAISPIFFNFEPLLSRNKFTYDVAKS